VRELKFLNRFFWKYRWRMLLGIIFICISNYFQVLQPQVIREALDLLIEQVNTYRMYDGFELGNEYFTMLSHTLMIFGGIVLLLAIVMGVFLYLTRQTIIVMSRLIEYDLREVIYDHYQNLSLDFYKRNNTGDLMSRVTEDVNKVRMYLGPAIMYLANLISTIALVIFAMLAVSPTLTLYTLIPLPLLAISIYYVSNIIHTRSTFIQQQLSKLTSIAQEVFSGIRVVKSYVREKPQVDYFAKESDKYKDMSMELAKIDAWFFPLMVFMVGASTILTVYVGGLQVVNGSISAGNIAEFVIYVNMLTWPVTAIGWIASIVQQAAASQKRINEFLETKTSIVDPMPEDRHDIKGEITFENVSFVYPDTGIKAVDSVSFHLKAGEKLAIIGRTGSGKTTIADLLLRMYDVTEGRILIDGKDIREQGLANLRQQIGYVPQDIFLFSDSIHNNIAFGSTVDPTRDEVEEFAGHAAVREDIEELTLGFDTLVGERGVTLSGGQKQHCPRAHQEARHYPTRRLP
jgi:ATP-binding cassette subfamily B multidrug efflux pump